MAFRNIGRIEEWESRLNTEINYADPLNFLIQEIFDEEHVEIDGDYIIKLRHPDGSIQFLRHGYPLTDEGRYYLSIEPHGKKIILEAYRVKMREKSRSEEEIVVEVTLVKVDHSKKEIWGVGEERELGKAMKMEISYKPIRENVAE